MGHIGSEAAITGLLQGLEDPNSYVRRNAALVLGKKSAEAAIKGLIKALENPNFNVCCNAALALNKIDKLDPEADLSCLIKALEEPDHDDLESPEFGLYVREIAAEALGEIGSEVVMT